LPDYSYEHSPEVRDALTDKPTTVREEYVALVRELCWNPYPRQVGAAPQIDLVKDDIWPPETYMAVFDHGLLIYQIYPNAQHIRGATVQWLPPRVLED
jgi:hypothetical protein